MMKNVLYTVLELNIRLLLILIISGWFIGKIRQVLFHNFQRKKHGTFFLDFFNLVGIPIHECSHLLMGLLFGYHIDKVCLYRTLKASGYHNGTLGYVTMHPAVKSFPGIFIAKLGQFFIGIAPLIGGPGVIILSYCLLPVSVRSLFASFSGGPDAVADNLCVLSGSDAAIILIFLYLVTGIASNMDLSSNDLELAGSGLIFLECIFILIALGASLVGYNIHTGICLISEYLILICMVGIIGSLFALLISYLI